MPPEYHHFFKHQKYKGGFETKTLFLMSIPYKQTNSTRKLQRQIFT